MEIGTYEEEFTLAEFDTLEKADTSMLRFLERLFFVLGYKVTLTYVDERYKAIRRITATYQKIDP